MENAKSINPEGREELISDLRRSLKGKTFHLYYPVYINTFSLAYIFEKYKIGLKPTYFIWSDIVPKDLLQNLRGKSAVDILYCFSSTDKESIFRDELQKLIKENNLPYKVSKPGLYFEEHGRLDIDVDIDYSNFSLKYLFFQDKINIIHIHEFGKKYFEMHGTENPYLSKLLSILLARGYQTIQIETDIRDESKGLLRKLLHEEFGFKFRIAPNQPEYKANNTLLVETKGGQQSFEEIRRQRSDFKLSPPSTLKTFVIPEKKKYTSKTKLIAIYKADILEDNPHDHSTKELRKAISSLSKLIFENPETLFEEEDNLCDDFVIKNLQYIADCIKWPDETYSDEKFETVKKSNSFLQSLQLYSIVERTIKEGFKDNIKEKGDEKQCANSRLFSIVKSHAQYLQIKNNADFIACLKDHHISFSTENIIKPSKEFVSEFIPFCRKIINIYNAPIQKRRQKIMVNGLFLLKLIIDNPNGFDKDLNDNEYRHDTFIKKIKDEKENFIKKINDSQNSTISDDKFLKHYNSLRLIAEDLNYLIVEERLLCDPKIIFKILDEFDLSEFEYLYSIEYGGTLLSKNKPGFKVKVQSVTGSF